MLIGLVAFFAMPKDIFPAVDIPEVNLVWYYPHSEFHTAAGADALQKNIATVVILHSICHSRGSF